MRTAQPHEPEVFQAGALCLIIPDASVRLRPSHWRDLGFAMILEADGAPGPARTLIADLERRLGVNDAHREALATSPDQVLARIREAKRRAMLERSGDAARAAAPKRDQDIEAALAAGRKRLAGIQAAMAALAAENAKKNRQKIKALKADAARLARKIDEVRQIEAKYDGIFGEHKEGIILALEKGDEIEALRAVTADFALDQYGARILERKRTRRGDTYMVPALVYGIGSRIRKVTGIKHAYAKGYLDSRNGRQADALLQTGEAYGEAYVIHKNLISSSGEGGGGFGPKGPQIKQVEAGELLAVMRRPLTTRQVEVLDRICGKGMRVREAATDLGAGVPSTVRALVGGLRVARMALTAAREAGEVGKHRARLQAAHRALQKIRI